MLSRDSKKFANLRSRIFYGSDAEPGVKKHHSTFFLSIGEKQDGGHRKRNCQITSTEVS